MKLTKMSEEEIYERYEFTNNCDSEKTNRKALYKMLVDIEKIDPNIPYNNYYLNYFELGGWYMSAITIKTMVLSTRFNEVN